jgi:hypothetical protein
MLLLLLQRTGRLVRSRRSARPNTTIKTVKIQEPTGTRQTDTVLGSGEDATGKFADKAVPLQGFVTDRHSRTSSAMYAGCQLVAH